MDTFARQERELLGAIVYTAGIILWLRRQNEKRTEEALQVIRANPPVELSNPPIVQKGVWFEWDDKNRKSGLAPPIPPHLSVDLELVSGEVLEKRRPADCNWSEFATSNLRSIAKFRIRNDSV